MLVGASIMRPFIILLLLCCGASGALAQQNKTDVFPGGGGWSGNTEYSNFGTLGQPISVGTVNGSLVNREGFIPAQEHCADPSTPGAITGSQTICEGDVPSPLTAISPPDWSSDIGELEYRWQYSTEGSDTGFYDVTPIAAGPGYAPGAITQTTWFRRLVRVSCNPDWLTAKVSNVVCITVSPTTVGGAVIASSAVCSGSLPLADLVLAGQMGLVEKWQRSTRPFTSWTDIAVASDTLPRAAAGVLLESTQFRAIVRSGVCDALPSAPVQIAVNDCAVTGYVKYLNVQSSGINGVRVKVFDGPTATGTPRASVVTATSGFYSIPALPTGVYTLRLESAGGGNWLTWGGVNSSDYLAVLRHAQGSTLLAPSPLLIRMAGDVKAPTWATPPLFVPTIDNTDALAMRTAYTSNNPTVFDVAKWLFTQGNTPGVRGTLATPTNYFTDFTITVDSANAITPFFALCAGDVNASYFPPSGNKKEDAHPLIAVRHEGTVPLSQGGAAELPVRVETAMEVGAVTLLFRDDPSVRITGARIAAGDDDAVQLVRGDGVTRLEWCTLTPRTLRAGDPLLYLTMEALPLYDGAECVPEITGGIENELGDANGRTIPDAGIILASLSSDVQAMTIDVHPNPVRGQATVQYALIAGGNVHLALYDMMGREVRTLVQETRSRGSHMATLPASGLAPGSYLLRMTVDGGAPVQRMLVVAR